MFLRREYKCTLNSLFSVLFGPKLQTRYCVIHGGNFYYYVRSEDKKQAGCFKLEGRFLGL